MIITDELPSNAVLSVRHLTKTFGSVLAIDDVSLDVLTGEVLGIVGDNGAGKSTFLSLLTGYNHPDSGQFFYQGNVVRVSSPSHSRKDLKMEMIYQDLAMAPDLSVWQNLFIGQELRKGLFLDVKTMRQRATQVLADMNTKIHPNEQISNLSGGERQLVAVARALLFEREIVLMDEPTAAISIAQVDRVMNTIKDLNQKGKTVILVSHRLEDIVNVCDRVAIFNRGRISDIVQNDGLTVSELIHLMFSVTP